MDGFARHGGPVQFGGLNIHDAAETLLQVRLSRRPSRRDYFWMGRAQTGQEWSGSAWMETLDGSGRARAARAEVGTLTATRVLYGRQ